MDPFVLANGLISLLELLIPKLTEAIKNGEVSPQEQQDTRGRFNALKANIDGMFSGPEWEITPPPAQPTTTPKPQ